MIKPLSFALVGLFVASQAAIAQTTTPKTAAECEQIWTTADANKDGKLDAAEMEANKTMMPQAMQSGSTTGSNQSGSTANSTGTAQSGTESNSSASNSTNQSSGEITGSTTQPSTGTASATDMTKAAFSAACVAG